MLSDRKNKAFRFLIVQLKVIDETTNKSTMFLHKDQNHVAMNMIII